MIGDKIKMLRISQGLNQTDFAKRLFVTPAAVSQWEKGTTRPDMDRLMKIAKEFSVPLDFFTDEDNYTETELITQQVLTKLNNLPKTSEARILAKGVDKLPKEQREQALAVFKAVFKNHAEDFEKGKDDDDT